MATCYDCFHCEACSNIGDSGYSYLKEDASKCKYFKSKADVVEVVRCKDCEYWQDKNSKGTQGVCLCGEKDMNYGGEFYPFANDFCSYGTPKERDGEK